MDAKVLCFGGPLNEQVVRVRDVVFLAPAADRMSFSLSEQADPIGPAIRTVRYDVERVAAPINGEQQVWEVAVADGFPRERITDAMNAVLTLTMLPICAAHERSA